MRNQCQQWTRSDFKFEISGNSQWQLTAATYSVTHVGLSAVPTYSRTRCGLERKAISETSPD